MGVEGRGDAQAPQGLQISLEDGEHHDATLRRAEAGALVRFVQGPSLWGRSVFLFCNYVGEEDEFVRARYRALEWRDGVAELRVRRPGTFHYYFVYSAQAGAAGGGGGAGPGGSGWLRVPPLVAGLWRPDELCCLTLVTKCLGPLSRWKECLRLAHEAHYNALHFTPVQRLGLSGSAYSVADRLALDPRLGAVTFADLEELLGGLRRDWRMASLCDVVLNHTANETPWLADHPDATYNARDCPHLRPAALLDHALASLAVPVTDEATLDGFRRLLQERLLPSLRLHELFCCDEQELRRQFVAKARNRLPAPPGADEGEELKLIQDPQFRRLKSSVDMELALRLYNRRSEGSEETEEARVQRCADAFVAALRVLNDRRRADVGAHEGAAVNNCVAHVRYERLAADGPKKTTGALLTPYFTWPSGGAGAEEVLWGPLGALVQAHNGWVMGGDPLEDFASHPLVYLRRELVAWGDSVKLRYGEGPDACPFLWRRMREYVELTAELFDGVRLDNCHCTPLHVAEYMMDAARNVKPHLYVVAELFTDSARLDNVFANRLGLDSLVREGMSAGTAHELGRLVHRYGGRAVGSYAGLQPPLEPPPALAHAMFLDVTHDNECPLKVRSVRDVAASAALVASAHCGVGSTRGLDELLPHAVHVVDEARLYPRWADAPAQQADGQEPRVSLVDGMLVVRRALNDLHRQLARDGFDEVFVDQLDERTVAVTRHCPKDRSSVVVVACTSFSECPCDDQGEPLPHHPPRPLVLEGQVDAVLLDVELVRVSSAKAYQPHPTHLLGLQDWKGVARPPGPLASCDALTLLQQDDTHTTLGWASLRPGRALALRVLPLPGAQAALDAFRRSLSAPLDFADLDLTQLNALLFRSDAEERDASLGQRGVYDVPGHGPLAYAGLHGPSALFQRLAQAEDLAHPLADNVRQGDWLLDYCWRRLDAHPAQARVKAALQALRGLPRFLQPAFANKALQRVRRKAEDAALLKMAPGDGSRLWRLLALSSVALVGAVPSAPLPTQPPHPSLAAGLPHFATGHMRCWGRDTFVALRGLLLLTGRPQEAKAHILGFGACLRHGLIPNLLDGGKARFNCRDAVWWWLLAIQQFCDHQGDYSLLKESVKRLFPRDDAPQPKLPPGGGPPTDAPVQPLHDIMQEALDVHFQGLVFRERNAGVAIDAHMTDAGFNVQIGIDPDSGFPFGGNLHNCGTWMDKMGSSEANKGVPATPRDGAAVELVALAYAAAEWLNTAHAAGAYPHPGITRCGPPAAAWTWAQWAERLKRNAERRFWVPPAPGAPDERPDLVHRRAIYKDTYGGARAWADHQLRCNYAVAISVAPTLWNPSHAKQALATAGQLLVGGPRALGMRTLDPGDWAYVATYRGDDASHGHGYHQGPEWLWPLAHWLRARLLLEGARAANDVRARLGALAACAFTNEWGGLPELVDPDGAPCPGACPTQAWSSAVVLEVLHELRQTQNPRELPSAD